MKEYTGWLFDLYAHPKQGIILWLVGEDKKPHSFTQPFQITFYVGGPFHRLRQLWKFLQEKPVRLSRTQREDLHEGMKDVLEVNVTQSMLRLMNYSRKSISIFPTCFIMTRIFPSSCAMLLNLVSFRLDIASWK